MADQFRTRSELQPHYYESVITRTGWDGLFKNMQKAVKDYLFKPYCIIMEDDCELTPAYSARFLEKLIDQAVAAGADVLLGGIDQFSAVDKIPGANNIVRVHNFRGTEFMVLFNKFFKTFIEAPTSQPPEIFLGYKPFIKKVVACPFISYQYDSRSNFGRDENVRKGFVETESRICNQK
ncbi:hypothetical protein PV783_34225 [Chitinophaga sp. CC14]|uniref:hypothetical protein n=1 Tax=Chitinophaga sp. CC14 TaxID=3029199 RepID=UPI003B78364E